MRKTVFMALFAIAVGANAQTTAVSDSVQTTKNDTVTAAPIDTKADPIAALTKKAESGDKDAQFELATAYFEGNGVVYSEEDAVKWYRKAAEQGHADAQFNLGLCYYGGVALPKSRALAIEWYRKAAAQGHKAAQEELDYLMGQRRKK